MVDNILKLTILATLLAILFAPIAISSDKVTNADSGVNLVNFGGTYVIKTQMIMPNLEENLRYANATVTKCLRRFVPDDLFPILSHQSLDGCKLSANVQENISDRYTLYCTGTNQTQGHAQIIKTDSILRGTVNVRMGGKNMTFSQRIVATRTSNRCSDT